MAFPVAFRKNLLEIKPYVPGKPIEDLERELGIKNASKIASNENPLGPSPKVVQALEKALPKIHRYPDGGAYNLSHALAKHLGVQANQLLLGHGSNELIVRLGQMVLNPGDEVISAEPGFFVYSSTALLCEAVPRPQPLRDFRHDLKLFERAINHKTKAVFIANPNNPTGTMIPLSEVEAFLQACPPHILVVLDEAYYEYVDDPNYFESLKLLPRYPNLVILRTFSKAFGLAGLRVGYGVAHPEVVEVFQKIREPFNVNGLAMVAAEAALGDLGHVRKVVDLNRVTRQKLFGALKRLGLNPALTQANFVYFEAPNAQNLYEQLLKKGIIVRPMGQALRITTGTEEETDHFLEVFQEILVAGGINPS
ncbi:MAG TPA: histidinol-phosphate transaminase [bacterium]|nr:histidinol-phosphate transaminase [bacterium]